MNNILDKHVLKLNKLWEAVGMIPARDAIVFLCSENDGNPPGYVMDYEKILDENGNEMLQYANPVLWDDWIKLPVRDSDFYINTSRGKIRFPKVIICANYAKVPMKNTRWSTGNVHKRDGYVCAYTLKKLTHKEATVDHIKPRSRGGKDSWDNTVTCDRAINTLKADRTPEEAGLTLHRKPKAPAPSRLVIRKSDVSDPDQALFLPIE
jgi:hypothetical protein